MQHPVIIIAPIKYIISKLITNTTNFTNSFTPSVIGVSIPNKNNAGPIRICTSANILRSHKLTNPVKTRTTSISITIITIISRLINKWLLFYLFE